MNRVFGVCLAGILALALRGLTVSTSVTASAAALACESSTAAPVDPYPGTTAAASNFESGSLSGFQVFTSGTGAADVSLRSSHSNACAALLHTTTDAGSIAKMSVGLAAGATEVYADGWFNIAAEGIAGNNVPYFRFFSGGARILDVLRQNVTRDLVLRVASPTGYVYAPLTGNVRLGTWHHLVMHVVPGGPSTGVQIWWDGKSIYANDAVNISATTADKVQLGSEHDQQMGEIYVDDVIINSRSAAPSPIPGSLPPPTLDPSRWLNDLTGDATGDLTAWKSGGDPWLYRNNAAGNRVAQADRGPGRTRMTANLPAGNLTLKA